MRERERERREIKKEMGNNDKTASFTMYFNILAHDSFYCYPYLKSLRTAVKS